MYYLTDIQKVDIVNRYLLGGISCNQLAKDYGFTCSTVWQLLKRRGIKINNNHSQLSRKYTLNENYFDVIDTEAKAYFLGLLYADGYNCEQRNLIVLSLQEKDKDILEKMKVEIDSNKPLFLVNYRCKNNTQNQLRLSICSKRISENLKLLGCPRAKTFTLKFPSEEQVPEYLIRHFIRGYFDGDGCLYVNNPKKKRDAKYEFSISSNEDFCLSFKDFIAKNFGIYCSVKTRHPDRKNSSRTLRISGRRQVYRVLDWLYDDSTVYLNRKFDKYILNKKI